MMASEVIVNEPVNMLYRVQPGGQIQPTSFVWRNQTRYVSDVGRTWEERIQGITQRCFMVQTVDGNTFEVRYAANDDAWTIHRAWLRDLAV
jgi:hypothetical protein